MGDYTINNRKEEVKIGTCGAGYYTTFKMLENLKVLSYDSNYYLDKTKGIYCAFPFPEYDTKECGEISQFHDDLKIHFTIDIPTVVELHHGSITHHIHPRGGANGGVNMFFPCPYTPGGDISTNFDRARTSINLNWEYRKDGCSYIMGSCPYCNSENYFSKEEAESIIHYNVPPLDRRHKLLTELINSNPDNIRTSSYKEELKQIDYKKEVFNRIKKIYNI